MKKGKESVPTTKKSVKMDVDRTERILIETIRDIYGKDGEKTVGRKK